MLHGQRCANSSIALCATHAHTAAITLFANISPQRACFLPLVARVLLTFALLYSQPPSPVRAPRTARAFFFFSSRTWFLSFRARDLPTILLSLSPLYSSWKDRVEKRFSSKGQTTRLVYRARSLPSRSCSFCNSADKSCRGL